MVKKFFFMSFVAMLIVFFISFSAEAMIRKANVEEMNGTVEVSILGGTWVPASIGMSLAEGDIIRTDEESTAVLLLEGVSGTASVELYEGSELSLTELFEDKGEGTQLTFLDLAVGQLLITSKKLRSEKSKFRVKTPTSIIGVRGTTFSISVEADGV